MASAPNELVAIPYNQSLDISFNLSNGVNIVNYQYAIDGSNNGVPFDPSWISFDPSITSSPVTILGLINGRPYSIYLRAVIDGDPLTFSDTSALVSETPNNNSPTFTIFNSSFGPVNEDTEIQISFADISNNSNAFDVDGSVVAFVLSDVNNGTLKIGNSDASSAWVSGSNDTVDSLKNAYWTPHLNLNGLSLNAFKVVAKDDSGAVSTSEIQASVDVSPVNDPPTISYTLVSNINGSVTDTTGNTSSRTATGTLDASDVDLSNNLTWDICGSLVNIPIITQYGTMSFTNSGTQNIHANWTYDVSYNSVAFKQLTSGQTATETFLAKVKDYLDASATQLITITITGINDIPTITTFNSPFGPVNEEAELQISFADIINNSNASDVDGSVVAFVLSDVSNGTLKIGNSDASSAWVFGSNDIVDSLKNAYWTPSSNLNGLSLNAFKVVAKDTSGALSTQEIQATVDVSPINDIPTLTAFNSPFGPVNEDTELQISFADISNNSNVSDIEGSVVAFVLSDVSNGTLKIGNSDASSAWVSGSNDTVDSLKNAYWTPGLNLNGTKNAFKVVAKDASGELSTQSIQATVDVNPINDPPTISYTSISDISGGVTDTSGDTSSRRATGTLVASDVDLNDILTWDISGNDSSTPIITQYGTMSFTNSGTQNIQANWTYDVSYNSVAFKQLTSGQTAIETFLATVQDISNTTATQLITITITGINDIPFILLGGDTVGSVSNIDGNRTITGIVDASDVDLSGNLTWDISGTGVGTYGTISIDPSGANNLRGVWTYGLSYNSDAYKQLLSGQTATDTFYVRASDYLDASATQLITITITGINDTDINISGSVSANVSGSTVDVSGILTTSYIDLSGSLSWNLISGTTPDQFNGTFSIASNVSSCIWTYHLDNTSTAYKQLKEGDSVQETFTIKATDYLDASATRNITINIIGINDIPTLTTFNSPFGPVDEDTELQISFADISNNSNASDIDGSVVAFVLSDVNNGTLKIGNSDASSAWVSGSNDTVDSLKNAYWTPGLNLNGTKNAFKVVAKDASGALSTQSIQATVDVNPINDPPTISYTSISDISGGVTDTSGDTSSRRATGTLVASDVDLSGDLLWDICGSFVNIPIITPYGTMSFTNSGTQNIQANWTYDVSYNSVAFKQLTSGQTAIETFLATVQDISNTTAIQLITINITGINDRPFILLGSDITGSASNNTRNATGIVDASDVDLTGNLTWDISGTNVGTYGTISVSGSGDYNRYGTWSYDLAYNSDAYKQLKSGQTATDTLYVRLLDDLSANIIQPITITITGINDTDINISSQVSRDVSGSTVDVSGILTTSYIDLSGSLSWNLISGTTPDQFNGTFSIASDVSSCIWTYHLDNTSTAYKQLKVGDSVQETFTVKATDYLDASASRNITINIIGINDSPTAITGTSVGSVSNSVLSITETLNTTDIDIGDVLTWDISGDATKTYGTLSLLDSSGVSSRWKYDLSNNSIAYKNLRKDDIRPESFTVRVYDQTVYIDKTITITITGINDSPTSITGTSVGSVSNSVLSITETLNTTDIDIGDVLTWDISGDATKTYGKLSLLDSSGVSCRWKYDLSNNSIAYKNLRKDASASEVFTVRVYDQTVYVNQTITLTITGINDSPTAITGTSVGSVSNSVLSITETLNTTDIDIGDVLTWDISGDATTSYGKLSLLDSSGVSSRWKYDLSNNSIAYKNLRKDDIHTELFTVRVYDQTVYIDKTITITITGINDVPIIISGGDISGNVADTSPSNRTTTGILDASDIDLSGNLTWDVSGASSITTKYGKMTIDPSGANNLRGVWTYDLSYSSIAYKQLPIGIIAYDTFTAKVKDYLDASATQIITIRLTGINDSPFIITGTTSGSVRDVSGSRTSTGTFDASDVDISNNNLTWDVSGSSSIITQFGTMAIVGSTTNNLRGTWTYTLNTNSIPYKQMKINDISYDTFTVNVKDETGATATSTVNITITGINDAPIIKIGGDLSGNATDTSGNTSSRQTTGSLYAYDYDLSGGLTWDVSGASTITTKYGTMTMDTCGNTISDASGYANYIGVWTYDLSYSSIAYKQLPIGIVTLDTFIVKVKDYLDASATQLITIRLTGINDPPTINIGGTTSGSVRDISGSRTSTGTFDASDIDISNNNLTWDVSGSSSITTQYGTMAIVGSTTNNLRGTWTYILNTSSIPYKQLINGITATDTFTVNVKDEVGATATSIVNITITGINDAPIIKIGGDLSGNATDTSGNTSSRQTTGSLYAYDYDLSGGLTWDVSGASTITTKYGTMTMDTCGNTISDASGYANYIGVWQYTLDPNSIPFKQLPIGIVALDTFTVKVKDYLDASATQLITIRLTGINDSPTINIGGTTSGSVQDVSGSRTSTGTFDASDVDISNNNLTWDVSGSSSIITQFGTMAIVGSTTNNLRGTWTYTLNTNSIPYKELKLNGITATDTFNVNVKDETGATATSTVNITITGINDTPIIKIGGDLSGNATDTSGNTSSRQTTGSLYAYDYDLSGGLTWDVSGASTITTKYGTMTMDTCGNTISDASGYANYIGVWNYTLDPNSIPFKQLPIGIIAYDTFIVKVKDYLDASATQLITIRLTGINDSPTITIGGTTSGSVQDVSGSRISTGTFDASDVDISNNNLTWDVSGSSSIITQFGTMAIVGSTTNNLRGTWTYTLKTNSIPYKELKLNDISYDTFTVNVKDETGATATSTVQITITGINDTPQIKIGGDISGNATDTSGNTSSRQTTGSLYAFDYDLSGGLTWDVSGASSITTKYGTMTMDTCGNTISDASGYANYIGVWNYTLDPNSVDFQRLRQGVTAQDIFTVKVKDYLDASATQLITIRLTGINDSPTIIVGGDTSGNVTDTSGNTSSRRTTGILDASDIDLSGNLTWDVSGSTSIITRYGTMRVDPSNNSNLRGLWTYDLSYSSIAYKQLTAGQTIQDSMNINVKDYGGLSATQPITINVTGINDPPILNAFTNPFGPVNEDTELRITFADISNNGSVLDYDLNLTGFVISDISNGTLKIGNADASYAWTYGLYDTVDATNNAYWTPTLNINSYLNSYKNAFKATAIDSSGALSITRQAQVNVIPVNDAPTVITPNPLTSQYIGVNQTLNYVVPVTSIFADVDIATNADVLSYKAFDASGTEITTLTTWLKFDSSTRILSGIAPATAVVKPVKIRATDISGAFVDSSYINISVLPITSSTTINLTQNDISYTYGWPLTLDTSGTTVKFAENLTFTRTDQYFIIGNNNIVIDGSGYSMTLNTPIGYPGLVQNGTLGSQGRNNITVQNISVVAIGSTTLLANGGWIGQSYFGRGLNTSSKSTNVLITNCDSSGILINSGSGGICGQYAGRYGQLTVSNCYSTRDITGIDAGGICGQYTGDSSGNVSVVNCYSSGIISGSGSGGICGSSAGNSNGFVSFSNCYSTGAMSGSSSGGICGSSAGNSSGNVSLTSCYSTGAMSGLNVGGICGSSAGNSSGIVSLSSCYSSGIISGSGSGGICGSSAGTTSGTVSLSSCYSTGAMSGTNCGGICGSSAGITGKLNITSCYSVGYVDASGAGGICGDSAGSSTGKVDISYCYSSGMIRGSSAGGICGSNAGITGNLYISSCFTIGDISGSDSGGICGLRTKTATIQNCYSAGAIKGKNVGGICGSSAGYSTGTLAISNCYSTGNIIDASAGGICGYNAGDTTGTVLVSNCYVVGNTTGNTPTSSIPYNKIFGTIAANKTSVLYPNSGYELNGSSWNNVNANTYLTGVAYKINSYATDWSHLYSRNKSYVITLNRPTSELIRKYTAAELYGGGYTTIQLLAFGYPQGDIDKLPSGTVSLAGTLGVGQQITASNSLTDPVGLGSIIYNWYGNERFIAGATSSTYTFTDATYGQKLSVNATYTDASGNIKSSTVYSNDYWTMLQFKASSSVWSANSPVQLPFINSEGSFQDVSYNVSAPDASSNITATITFIKYTGNGNNDGLHFNISGLPYLNSSSTLDITNFYRSPLSRNAGQLDASGTFANFAGKITATDVPTMISNTSFAGIFYNSTASQFGNIGNWDTSLVISMKRAFYNATAFNQYIGTWNTSACTTISEMFNGATLFNNGGSSLDTSGNNWNTSAIIDMSGVFNNAIAFNQNIGSWNTGACTTMINMFNGAATFNQNIGNWNTGACTKMTGLFNGAVAFNQNVGNWNTSVCTTMTTMFSGAIIFNNGNTAGTAGNRIDTSGNLWNTALVQDMSGLFNGAVAFNQIISNWTTNVCTSMANMFNGAITFNNGNVAGTAGNSLNTVANKWNTSAVQNMSGLFNGAVAFNQNIGSWTTNVCTTMANMFSGATTFNNGNVAGTAGNRFDTSGNLWNTALVQNMSGMFNGAVAFNQIISNWTTNGCTTMANMFSGAITFNNGNAAGVAGNSLNTVANKWNTSAVQNMSGLFNGAVAFNQIISSWTTNVCTTMANMFSGATTFNNGNLAGIAGNNLNTSGNIWNTALVQNMSGLFNGAVAFNQNIGSWTTNICTNMSNMFNGATRFNNGNLAGIAGNSINLNGNIWNTGAVLTMSGMFYNAAAFNQNIGFWIVSNCTNMSNMFNGAITFNNSNIPGITGIKLIWNVSAVQNMSGMFCNTTTFNQDIKEWNTSAVQNMSSMFQGTAIFNNTIDTSGSWWVVSSCTNMSSMFQGNTVFNNPIGNWNLSSCTNMSSMFRDNTIFNNSSITTWNTSAVQNMSSMFQNNTIFNQNIGSWNLSSCTNMANMFQNNTIFNQNIGNWDTHLVANTSNMFNGSVRFNNGNTAGTSGNRLDTSGNKWNMSNCTDMTNMFYNAVIFNQNIGSWNTSAVQNMANMFYNAYAFNNGNVAGVSTNSLNWNTTSCTSMANMFYNALIFNQNISSWDTPLVSNMSNMFYNVASFNQYIGNWNTSSCANMSNMFYNVASFNQYIGNWNTSSCANMSNMFKYARSFNNGNGVGQSTNTLDTSGNIWNTTNCTNMNGMFNGAWAFNQNIGGWNTANCTNMSYMFCDANAFNQNIRYWNTAAVTEMSNMFCNAIAFNQPIDTSSNQWNTANCTIMDNMFNAAFRFNQNIQHWNTAKTTTMENMFYAAYSFKQPTIGNWNLTLVQNMTNMLQYSGFEYNTYSTLLQDLSNNTTLANNMVLGSIYTNRSNDSATHQAYTYLTNSVANGGKGLVITDKGESATADTTTAPVITLGLNANHGGLGRSLSTSINPNQSNKRKGIIIRI